MSRLNGDSTSFAGRVQAGGTGMDRDGRAKCLVWEGIAWSFLDPVTLSAYMRLDLRADTQTGTPAIRPKR